MPLCDIFDCAVRRVISTGTCEAVLTSCNWELCFRDAVRFAESGGKHPLSCAKKPRINQPWDEPQTSNAEVDTSYNALGLLSWNRLEFLSMCESHQRHPLRTQVNTLDENSRLYSLALNKLHDLP